MQTTEFLERFENHLWTRVARGAGSISRCRRATFGSMRFPVLSKPLAFVGIVLGLTTLLAAQDLTLPLWPTGAPDAIDKVGYNETESFWNNDKSWPLAKSVSHPSLEIFLPPKEKRNGLAVVICPGGGYTAVNIEKEGRAIARWLNEIGVTGFVLKYRLPSTAIMKDRTTGPLQDGQEAIRIVRRHATEWNIHDDQIGIMGFSSGGHLAATVSTLYSQKLYRPLDQISARPDFTILIYPLLSMRPENTPNGLRHDLLGEHPTAERIRLLSPELQLNAQTPPTFIAHSKKDPVIKSTQSAAYAEALKQVNVPVELHLYDQGEHGYGLGALPDWPQQWPEDLKHWILQRVPTK